MSSSREMVVAELFARISTNVLGTARRADGSAGNVPASGVLITVEDGALDAEPIMSPLQYDITHTVPITVEAGSSARSAMDQALQGIAAVVSDDPFLGGLVDWAEVSGPDVDTDAPTAPGGQQLPRLLTAQLTVTLSYLAPTPVG